MTQYPYPYQPPQPYGYYASDPYGTLKAPSQRASILMFVIGGLLLLFGTCNLISALMTPAAQIFESQQLLFGTEASLDPETLRTASIIGAAITFVLGLTTLMLATLVRKGSGAATIVAVVLVSVVLLFCLLMILVSVLAALTEPVVVVVGCIFAIPSILFVLLLFWLIQAIRNSSRIRAMQAQYQMQYWQYQQQQAYQQQIPPPPQPPPTNGSNKSPDSA